MICGEKPVVRTAVCTAHTYTYMHTWRKRHNTRRRKKSVEMKMYLNHIHGGIHEHLQKQKLTHTLASWT